MKNLWMSAALFSLFASALFPASALAIRDTGEEPRGLSKNGIGDLPTISPELVKSCNLNDLLAKAVKMADGRKKPGVLLHVEIWPSQTDNSAMANFSFSPQDFSELYTVSIRCKDSIVYEERLCTELRPNPRLHLMKDLSQLKISPADAFEQVLRRLPQAHFQSITMKMESEGTWGGYLFAGLDYETEPTVIVHGTTGRMEILRKGALEQVIEPEASQEQPKISRPALDSKFLNAIGQNADIFRAQ